MDRKVPTELLCPLCQSLFKEAVVTSCCGNSYCAECIEARIIDPDTRKCPGAECGNTEISIETLIPNRKLRDAAAAWESSSAPTAPAPVAAAPEPEQIRIRIGLKAPSATSISAPTFAGISPGTGIAQSSQPAVPVATRPPAPAPVAQPLGTAVPGLPPPISNPAPSLPAFQDVSLPPPTIRQELPPGIPGVPGLSQYGQPPPGIPGLTGTVMQQPQAMIPSFG
uniref:RING-type domain-containing protein n=1 Tax=Caenorhabditis japonica TaxID=281687 RepID=A0A8R1IJP6_CAEJA